MFEKIGEWFQNLFKSIGEAFTKTDGTGSFSTLERIIMCIVLILISWLIIKLICAILKKALGLKKASSIDRSAKSFIISIIKFMLWLFVAFLVISILGINITSFAGILSAVTVALGLSLQDVIASFASGVIILNQKYFLTDEYILVSNSFGQIEGKVIKISLIYTSLRTVNGQVVFINNYNIIKSNITNFTREKYRRVVYTVGVSYDSDIELVKNVLGEIVSQDNRVSKEHETNIHVDSLGDYKVDVVIKTWIDNNYYWDFYNSLSEKVLLEFRKNKIDIPSITTLNVIKDK